MALFDWLTADRQDVREAYNDLKFMLRSGDEMFAASSAQLLDNEILDVDLQRMDEEINNRERHLRVVVHDHIQARPGDQLEDMLKLLGIVQEAERIGDLAKTISQIAQLADRPRLGPAVDPYRQIRNRVSGLFSLTRAAFDTRNVKQAEQVLAGHGALKADANARIAQISRDSDLSVNEAVVFALGTRMMGRVSSHLANIASAVVLPYEDIRRNHPAR